MNADIEECEQHVNDLIENMATDVEVKDVIGGSQDVSEGLLGKSEAFVELQENVADVDDTRHVPTEMAKLWMKSEAVKAFILLRCWKT